MGSRAVEWKSCHSGSMAPRSGPVRARMHGGARKGSRARCAWPSTRGTIGYVSGAEILIEAARVLKSRRDILILCVGGGPLRDRLADTAARERLDNLRFLPFQPAEDLDQVQATADIGLVTLLSDAGKTSVPSKVLGYLAAGRPVVASVAADSDTAKMVEEAGCGRVTTCMDPVALAGAIRELADDPDTRSAMGKTGADLP